MMQLLLLTSQSPTRFFIAAYNVYKLQVNRTFFVLLITHTTRVKPSFPPYQLWGNTQDRETLL